MRPIRPRRADLSATFESLGTLLSSHRPLTRVSLVALSFILIVAFSQQAAPTIQAGPEQAPYIPESLLPQTVGVALPSDETIVIPFDVPMDPASVEAAVQLLPAQNVQMEWNGDFTELSLDPAYRWRTDERYLVVVAAFARTAEGDPLTATRRYEFTTQTAPAVTDFQVRLTAPAPEVKPDPEAQAAAIRHDPVPPDVPGEQPPTQTAVDVSATSSITISFSAPMDTDDVEAHFVIAPDVAGELGWRDSDLVFTPTDRLEPGTRYTISVIGSHDADGNLVGGKANFSFIVQPGAQLTKTQPEADATDVEPATVEMWFSQPMDVEATNEAFGLKDTSSGTLVGGLLTWNEAATQLTYTPDAAFAGGRTFEVGLADGARDADGNAVKTTWTFETKAPPVVEPPATPAPAPAPAPAQAAAPPQTTTSPTTRSAPVVPAAAPATSLAGYALNQVNAARAAYGFAPVVLDANVSAAAAAHAWDQARNNYFSHYGLNGSTRESRLRAAGVSFGWSGENQCYRIGMSQQGTLDWCHAQFMAEPYPGHWNHIANILNPNARRMGVGIATVGGKTVVTWNFTD